MLQSMTGFGNAALNSELGKISVDIRSLNSKNIDLNYNLNPIFKNVENEIRIILTQSLKRGKVDLKINFRKPALFDDKLILTTSLKQTPSYMIELINFGIIFDL